MALWPRVDERRGARRAAGDLLHVGSFFTTVQLAATWLEHSSGLPAEGASRCQLWVGLGAASVVGSVLFGRVSDLVGKRNFVLATSAVLVGCFLYLAREPEALGLLIGGSVLAVCASARTGPLQALVSGLVPRHQLNALMSWRGFAMQIGVSGFAVAAAPAGRTPGLPRRAVPGRRLPVRVLRADPDVGARGQVAVGVDRILAASATGPRRAALTTSLPVPA
jgi:MFS family permease